MMLWLAAKPEKLGVALLTVSCCVAEPMLLGKMLAAVIVGVPAWVSV